MLFDAHLHIFEPAFPLPGNQGSIPEPFTVEDYRRRTASLGVVGGLSLIHISEPTRH